MQQPHGNFTSKSHDNLNDSADGPNLTNPKRVKKLTKFFGEDPPLMRLFLKKLGYEVSAEKKQSPTEKITISHLPFRNTRISSSRSEWA